MTAPRLEVDLTKVEHNAQELVDRLAVKGIRVTGVTKAVLGAPAVAAAMRRGGVVGLGDSRVDNLTGLQHAGVVGPKTLIRTPMASQVDAVVAVADVSLNTEAVVLAGLDDAARRATSTHGVVLMVELGDLREGIRAAEVVDAAVLVGRQRNLRLVGLGTNLACQSGVVPDQAKMDELTALAEQVEARTGRRLEVVSGGNSANLDWALASADVGRIDELRLGEAILLGTEPLHRHPIDGLHLDAFGLVAEVIEMATKPSQAWGEVAQGAFGDPPVRADKGLIRQAILALGRQDVDPDGLVPPLGISVLGMSSDHLVVDVGDHDVDVGQELRFGLGYGGLVRAATSPFVAMCPLSHFTRPRADGARGEGGPQSDARLGWLQGSSSARLVSRRRPRLGGGEGWAGRVDPSGDRRPPSSG